MEKGVALTGVNGETSRSTIHRFKLELASRIRAALTATRLEAAREAREAAQQRVFAEAIRQGVSATIAAAIASRVFEAAANTEEGAGDG